MIVGGCQKLEWIPVTTCDVERLFSECRLILGDLRRTMSPLHMEALIFLSAHDGILNSVVFLVNSERIEVTEKGRFTKLVCILINKF